MNDRRCLINEVMRAIEKERMYVDSKLSIDDVARAVNSNRTYFSMAIKELGVGFPSFINNYRVQNAINLLLKRKNMNTPLGDIAELSGFTTVRQMNLYIRKSVGTTAGAFRLRVFRIPVE